MWPTFAAKSPEAARRAAARRYSRWRRRLWRHLSAIPVGFVLGALCHFFPERLHAPCAVVAKLLGSLQ